MPESFMRLPAVMNRTGLARSTIYAMIKQGTFPRQIKLSLKCAVWTESDIAAWIQHHIDVARPDDLKVAPLGFEPVFS